MDDMCHGDAEYVDTSIPQRDVCVFRKGKRHGVGTIVRDDMEAQTSHRHGKPHGVWRYKGLTQGIYNGPVGSYYEYNKVWVGGESLGSYDYMEPNIPNDFRCFLTGEVMWFEVVTDKLGRSYDAQAAHKHFVSQKIDPVTRMSTSEPITLFPNLALESLFMAWLEKYGREKRRRGFLTRFYLADGTEVRKCDLERLRMAETPF